MCSGTEVRRYSLVEVESTVLRPFCAGQREIGVITLLGYHNGTVSYLVSQAKNSGVKSYISFTTYIINHQCRVDCVSQIWLQLFPLFSFSVATGYFQTFIIICGLGSCGGLPPVGVLSPQSLFIIATLHTQGCFTFQNINSMATFTLKTLQYSLCSCIHLFNLFTY